MRSFTQITTLAALVTAIAVPLAFAQTTPAAPTAPAAAPAATMEKLSGVWIEGPGYEIKYGATYEVCSQRCLDSPKCLMIEYYRPEKKCNHYDAVRPRIQGGDSIVGIKRP
jgi:PAN domain